MVGIFLVALNLSLWIHATRFKRDAIYTDLLFSQL